MAPIEEFQDRLSTKDKISASGFQTIAFPPDGGGWVQRRFAVFCNMLTYLETGAAFAAIGRPAR